MAPARDRRTGFSRRRQYGQFIGYVLAVAGAAVGAVLLVASSFNPPLFSGLRMTVATVTTPVSAGLSTATNAAATVPEAIGGWIWAHRENDAMRAELAVARPLLARARVIAYDNRRLRALLAVRDREAEPVATARLVSSSASSGRRFALLNAGHFQGVRPGMPVRAPDGLVGRITETGPAAARVLLLSDAESIVPVKRTRDGLPAIAVGRGDGAVDIRSVNATNVRFAAGDVFVTSGIGGLYAPGAPVARVVAAGSDSVVAHLFAQPDTADFALVERAFMPMPPAQPSPPHGYAVSGYKPFAQPLPPGRARALPWATVAGGSLMTVLPVIATVPILPPLGLLMLLAWRLLARFALRPWAAAPLGAFDDLVSGQPLGASVLLWSLCFLGIDLIERRLVYRDFWQDWLVAAAAMAFCLAGGRVIAVPLAAHVDGAMLAQGAAAVLLFPLAARLVAWIDVKRGLA